MVARNRVVISGTLGIDASEVWSTGVTMAPVDGGPPVASQEDLQAWANAVRLTLNSATYPALFDCLGGATLVRGVRTEYYGQNNALVRAAESESFVAPGTGSTAHPFPTSVVFSMSTGLGGRSFRGRNYWPAVGALVTGNGRFGTSPSTTEMAADFVELLETLEATALSGAAIRPAIFSRTLDLVTPVTSVLVGDVPDTQRRRRDALVEAYVRADLTPGPP